MKDRVRNGGRCANDSDLAKPFHTKRTNLVIFLVNKDHVDTVNICMRRNVILGKVMVHHSANSMIRQGFFMKRHADAHYHSTKDLTACCLRVQNSTCCHAAHDPWDAH